MKTHTSALIAVCLFAVLALTSCTFGKSENISDSISADDTQSSAGTSEESGQSESSKAENPQNGNTEGTDSAQDGGSGESDDTASKKLLSVIKDAYGESYQPDIQVPQEELITVYRLEKDTYTDAAGEISSGTGDAVVIVRAKSGRTGDVKAALNSYRDSLIAESGTDTARNSQVVADNGYVMFIMLSENETGIDAFKAYFDSEND